MKRGLQYTLVLLLTAVTTFVNPVVSFAAQALTQADKSYYQKDNKAPNAELKLVEGHTQAAAGQQVHKLISPAWSNEQAFQRYTALKNSPLRNAYPLQLVKEYLFFIYPSHHFW